MEMLESIIDYIAQRKQKIIAVIYVHRIIDKKITGSTLLNLRMLRAVCGEHFFQNIVLVTSMWATVPKDSLEATAEREVELNQSPHFWHDMIEKGAKYERWDENIKDHHRTALQIAEMCRSRKDAPMLQVILERQKVSTIEDTSAGRILTEELRKCQEKQMRAIQAEEEERKMLQREAADLQDTLRATQIDVGNAREVRDKLAARQAFNSTIGRRPENICRPHSESVPVLTRRYSETTVSTSGSQEGRVVVKIRREDAQRSDMRRTRQDQERDRYDYNEDVFRQRSQRGSDYRSDQRRSVRGRPNSVLSYFCTT